MATVEQRAHLILVRAADNPKRQAYILEQCRRDILYWFDNFCWTFNPRERPNNFPFNLYPFQRALVLEIKDCIDRGEPFLIKKSRDMGVTWIILLVFQWYWLFVPGSDFHLTTLTEDDVDERGNKSTLFEKLRYNNQYMPSWMLPPLSKSDDAFMKLINPLNGNSITGQAPVLDFGRSQRYTAVLMDEMARLKNGAIMYSTIVQSTDCIIMPYTPFGKTNEAYRLANGEDNEVVSVAA